MDDDDSSVPLRPNFVPDVQIEPNVPNKKRKTKRHFRTKICLFGFGGFLAAVGLLVAIFWSFLSTLFLQKTMAVTRGSEVFNQWVETPIPIYFKLYMFNWTNPGRSLRGPEKPAFEQLGPYVFLKHQIKRNVTWNDNNDTITYLIEDQYHYFIPDLSNGSLSDRVTNVNMIPMIIGWFCRDLNSFEKWMVNGFLTSVGSNLVKTDTVGNMLFYGSNDPVLSILNVFKPFIKNLPLQDKFGYLYGQNCSTATDGVYTMHTGKDDVSTLGLASSWNYSNRSMLSDVCGEVKGSFGELYPPFSYHQDKLDMFGFPLCSSGPVFREGFSSISGIPTAIFVGKADSFSNETSCYCPPNEECLPSGAHDVSECQGVPLIMSWPHFLFADPVYTDSIDGMNPNVTNHQTRFEMSDVTAATITGRFRMQINIMMQPIEGMSHFKGVQKIVMPLFWTSQEADLPQSKLDQMYWVVKGVRWGRWVCLSFGLIGVLLLITGTVLSFRGFFIL